MVRIPFSINSHRLQRREPFSEQKYGLQYQISVVSYLQKLPAADAQEKSNRELRWSNKFYLESCDGGCANNYAKPVLAQMGS